MVQIQVPSPEEQAENKRKNRKNLGCGLLAGFFFFAFAGIGILKYGFENIEVYTWLTLLFGVISFGLLAYKFGDLFWNIFKQ